MILEAPNFILDIAFRTTTGKTIILRVAASVWGKPDECAADSALGAWDATKVWTERASAVLSGLPLILDDTKRAKHPRMIAEVLYEVANGRGRGRGDPKSLARTRTWRTVLISTGEARATSFTEDGGTRTRVIELYGNPFGREDANTRKVVDELNRGIRRAYGHAGQLYVRSLLARRSEWNSLRSAYRDAHDRYADSAPSSEAARLGQYFAAIEVAARFAHEVIPLPWAFDQDQLDSLWHQVAAEATDAAGELRALRDVVSWAYAHENSFWGREETDGNGNLRIPPGGWAGRWDRDNPSVKWKFLGFFPPVLERILCDLGYHPDAILSGWRDRGWLDVTRDDRKRFTKRMRIRENAGPQSSFGDSAHLIVIRRTAIDEADA
jgi:hypothetical protein